jgi:hypothetical protein
MSFMIPRSAARSVVRGHARSLAFGWTLGLTLGWTLAEPAAFGADLGCRPRETSRFWERLDALCQAGESLGQAEISDAALAAARDEVVAYCGAPAGSGARPAPKFAADASHREKTVSDLGASAGIAPSAPLPPQIQPRPPARLVELAARRVAPDENLRTGAMTSWLMRDLITRVCDDTHGRQWLPTACASLAGTEQPLLEFRRRLVRDVTELARVLQSTPRPANADPTARLIAALIATAIESPDWHHLGERLKAASGSTFDCSAPTAPPLPAAAAGDQVGAAAAILERLVSDGPDFGRKPEHYLRLVETELRASGVLAEGQALSAVETQAAQKLVAELGRGQALVAKITKQPDDPAALRELVVSMAETVNLGMTIASNRPFLLPPGLVGALDALLGGQLVQAAEALSGAAGTGPLPAELRRAIGLGLDFLRAPDDEARKRLLASLILGLGPWTAAWIFDVNVGAVALGASDLRLAGDLTLGYNAQRWGVMGFGYAREYDLTSPVAVDETSEAGGRVEGWYAAELGERWRLEGRMTLGGFLYDTQTTQGPADVMFTDQTSIMARGSLLAGIRYQKSDFAAGLWLGGGGQYEWYDPLVVSQNVTLTAHEDVQGEFDGRLRLQWEVLPNVIALRLRVDGSLFKLTRAQFAMVVDPSTGTTRLSSAETSGTQVQISSRGFVDVTALRLFGFMPAVHGGLDYVSLQNGSVSTQKALPVFGAGIRRDVF